MSRIKRFLITSFIALMMLTSAIAVTSCTVIEDFANNNIHTKVTVPRKAPCMR